MSMRVLSVVVLSMILALGSIALADDLPDLTKTPGVLRPGLSKAKICTIKWGRDQRHVTSAMKDQVFALYGISDAVCASYDLNRAGESAAASNRSVRPSSSKSAAIWPTAPLVSMPQPP